MALRFYNTLTRELEEFRPLDPPHVSVYACGPTVYRAPHIGNFRTFVFDDVLHRYLEWKGFDVRFVMNLTDVEDKIIDAAVAAGVPIENVTRPIVDAFFADLDTLGIRRVDHYPRATEHIDTMLALVRRLIDRGHAYVRDGSVYFDISSFPRYGRLSRVSLDANRAGAGLAARDGGVDADEYSKEDARDFALWKAAKDGERQAGAAWTTEWGEGRPGWHIECSAMSMAELGETFDIHTGGEDLIFPHHEDEIAQSEGATGKTFARCWLHVTHLKVDGEKMSKSKRNDFSIGELIERGHSPAHIRMLLLQGHYRRELNFSMDGLEDARAAIQRLLDFDRRLGEAERDDVAPPTPLPNIAASALADFEAALDDDLNTPAALGVLFPFVREVNAQLDGQPAFRASEIDAARHALERIDDVLGILELARARLPVDDELSTWVEKLLHDRQQARGRRDFAAADAIRDQLTAAGVTVEDTPAGPRWKLDAGR